MFSAIRVGLGITNNICHLFQSAQIPLSLDNKIRKGLIPQISTLVLELATKRYIAAKKSFFNVDNSVIPDYKIVEIKLYSTQSNHQVLRTGLYLRLKMLNLFLEIENFADWIFTLYQENSFFSASWMNREPKGIGDRVVYNFM